MIYHDISFSAPLSISRLAHVAGVFGLLRHCHCIFRNDAPILRRFARFFDEKPRNGFDVDMAITLCKHRFDHRSRLAITHPFVEKDDLTSIFTGAIVAKSLETSQEHAAGFRRSVKLFDCCADIGDVFEASEGNDGIEARRCEWQWIAQIVLEIHDILGPLGGMETHFSRYIDANRARTLFGKPTRTLARSTARI